MKNKKDTEKDKIYNALSDFINNELKIVLTVKNIKDGYADCKVHFETTERKNDERGWKVKREVFASELFTILDKTLVGADVKFNADANVIFVENVRIEAHEHCCTVYRNNEFIMYLSGRICPEICAYTAIALLVNEILKENSRSSDQYVKRLFRKIKGLE